MNISPHEPRVAAEHDSLAEYLSSVLTPGQLERPLLVSFTQWDFAIAAIAETTLTLSSMGSEVSLALWSDQTPLRDIGWQVQHQIATATRTKTVDQQMRKGLLAAGVSPSIFVSPPIRNWKPVGTLPVVSDCSRAAVRELTYRGAPLGRGVLHAPPSPSTPSNDSHVWSKKYVEKAARSFAYVYDQVSQVIKDRGITSIYIYNGRFLHDSAVTAAAIDAGLPILSYDTGGLDTDFDLTIDETHDWSALQTRMKNMFDRWDPADRDLVAGSWFEERINHVDPANQQFTGGQKTGLSIDRYSDAPLVVYFSSSGDEIAELDLDWSEYFTDQPHALVTLSDACRERGFDLVVRTHPHARIKPAEDNLDWASAVKVANPALHIDQHSSVDSYALMREAAVVVTYGSTTGVEAAYLGRPVIVMGPSAYDELGCAVRPRTSAELAELLQASVLPESVLPEVGARALPYGLMMKRRGFAFRYLDRSSSGSATLNRVPFTEPPEYVRHLSYALKNFVTKRLVRD
jgi:hypothetical protein